ncbi:hypothetical protein SAMD00019534_080330 [Acytostelium subglobosum LB1]|uniref:hypothetical protein n=1 Tax=Acytostelium subglobosum LB1 TaxID=1410327 RepID=UPI000644A195|nr:hypothetical protein SAMD00019534_080330 [Acytostelium subglobosum LB1]GAM24858.1 hypothetical protein SAMD00019534_080330 [Acytostelium subglobosum LB1]|eukprot:XP_012751947.1 hypothetical protein SAMD00019534_080330 [Acytostelium subglobosum LB1]
MLNKGRQLITSRIKMDYDYEKDIARKERLVQPKQEFIDGHTTTFATQPFYHVATALSTTTPIEYNITIITQTTIDRLNKVALMVDRWQAPVSVAIYVKDAEREIPLLHDMLSSFPSLLQFADIHLMHANNTRYPVNNLRNLAIINARTDFILIMDADFVIPSGTHDYLIPYVQVAQTMKDKLAFVFPSFSSSLDPSLLPNTKAELLDLIKQGHVNPSNLNVCPKCHGPTDYEQWYSADMAYKAQYKWNYEPYLLFDRTQTELFDEVFKGYGFDKNSHVFTMAVMGFKFFVQPESFIIHINHEQANWESTADLDVQLWDALGAVCDLIPEVKLRYNLDSHARAFDEPLQAECVSYDWFSA